MIIKQLDTTSYESIKNKYNISDLCAKVLASKQLKEAQIEDILFSKTKLKDLNLSFLTPVIEKLQEVKRTGQKILICGDYDCDGICATTILYDAFISYGINCGFYIPNRFKEGYGLHPNTVTLAAEKGYDVIITVDNGVKAYEALKLAKEKNIYVILTDHHNYIEEELIYDLFVHPNTMDKPYNGLCGAGVALLISRALIGHKDKHLMLACIATIGDVVPLLNVNRMIVKEGLDLLNHTSFIQIQKLANDTKKWDTKKIAFQIVPKFNSIGRLADEANANNIVRYLCANDPILIENMARQINNLNQKRKDLSNIMIKKASSLVDDELFQILEDESFHEGMNGIVASKLCSTLRKPVMVLSRQNEILKGSIRSNSVDLRTFFEDIKEDLIAYGGHKEAAGIAFPIHKLDTIRTYANKKIKQFEWQDELEVLSVSKQEINEESLASLSILEPLGCAFDLPFFHIQDSIREVTTLSKNQHLKLKSDCFSYLYFNHGNDVHKYLPNHSYHFIGTFEMNQYYNHKSINLIVDYICDNIYNKED